MKINLLPRFIAIFVVTLLAAYLVWLIPPRLGIDLAGGTSLLCELGSSKLGSSEKASQVAADVIAVLRPRGDPRGQRNIIGRPVGGKRTQIQRLTPPKKTQLAM